MDWTLHRCYVFAKVINGTFGGYLFRCRGDLTQFYSDLFRMIYNYQKVIKQYRDLFKRGMSIQDLHKCTHASIPTLQGILRPEFYKKRMIVDKNGPLLYKQGIPQERVAEYLGVSQSYISKRMGYNHIDHWDRPLYQEKQSDVRPRILEMIECGGKYSRGIDFSRIYDYRKVLAQYCELLRSGMSIKELHGKTGAPIRTLQRIVWYVNC
jgi:hypothetical protein